MRTDGIRKKSSSSRQIRIYAARPLEKRIDKTDEGVVSVEKEIKETFEEPLIEREEVKETFKDEKISTMESSSITPEEFFLKGGEKREEWTPIESYSSRRYFLWGGVAGLATLIAVLALLSTVFARVTVTVKPKVEKVSLQALLLGLDITVSKVMGENRLIPAERLIFTKKAVDEFEATGRENISEKAKGRVRIYNGFSSSPQSLVASTRFLTDSGIVYRLPQAVTIPGAKIEEGKIVPQFIEVELVADQAGAGGNLSGEVRLHIPGFKGTPKYEGFYAVALQGFSGGFSGEARVISRDDIKRAQESVTKRVYDEIREDMARKAPPGFAFIDKFSEIEITKVTSPRENTRRDKFTVEAEASGRMFIFREEDLITLLKEIVLKGDPRLDFVQGSQEFSYGIQSMDFEKGKAVLTLDGSIKTKAIVPEKELGELVKGKKEGSIIEALKSRQDIAQFSISFFPPWRSSAPVNDSGVRFLIEDPR
jgi:hypothetical protein